MTNSDEQPDFWTTCNSCRNTTKHETLKHETISGDDEYRFRRTFSIIRCKGCEDISFREKYEDFESTYPNDDGEWIAPETNTFYPKRRMQDGDLEVFMLPDVVSQIYSETLLAINEEALTLAGLGLRGIIEAVCNDLQVKGKNLEVRISRLATMGVISVNDATRLHAIRFLGNDAAHEIKKPRKSQVRVAMQIINHLVRSVYILEEEIKGSLDTMVTRPEELRSLLDKHVSKLSAGDELPLAAILGKDMRRLGAGAPGLEGQLTAEIAAGTYTGLSMGKIAPYAGLNGNVQHFVVS